jgi:hypothetical protein
MKITIYNNNFLYIECLTTAVCYNLHIDNFFDSFRYNYINYFSQNKYPISYDFLLSLENYKQYILPENIYIFLIKKYKDNIRYTSSELFNKFGIIYSSITYNICLELIKNYSDFKLSKIPSKFRDINLCKEALKNNYLYLSSVPKKLRNNKEILNVYLESFIKYTKEKYGISEENIAKLKNFSL